MGEMEMIILVCGGRLACKRFTGINSMERGTEGEAGRGREAGRRAAMVWDLNFLCWLSELGQEGWAFIPCFDQSLGAAAHGRAKPWARCTSLSKGRYSPVARQPQHLQQRKKCPSLKGIWGVCHGAPYTLQTMEEGWCEGSLEQDH